MIPLMLVHGWGFDPRFWDALRLRLTDYPVRSIDLGFFGRRDHPPLRRPLVVAHSMGLAWALAHLPRPWAGLLAVNAFPRFIRGPSFVEGVSPRVIDRMRQKYAQDPEAVATEFLGRCGLADPDLAGLDSAALGLGLEWLAGCDERAALAGLDCPVLALAGTADPIVSEPMSRALFAGRDLVLAERGGHLLPLTHPDWVASHLRALVARLP